MSDTGRGIDALGLFLTGGASNTNPDSSLGGERSTLRVNGLGALVSGTLHGIRIDHVFPGCGEGSATLAVSGGNLVFTPPGGSAGTPVAIAAGETKVVSGVDIDKAVRVTRIAGFTFTGSMTLTLVNALNGVLAMANVTDAQRQAGVTTYRSLMLYAHGLFGVINIKLWMPPVSGSQAVFSLATEDPNSSDVIQTIANETTAPSGLSWVTPTTEGTALLIPSISAGNQKGLWIRKTFPAAGTVAAKESFVLNTKYEGA